MISLWFMRTASRPTEPAHQRATSAACVIRNVSSQNTLKQGSRHGKQIGEHGGGSHRILRGLGIQTVTGSDCRNFTSIPIMRLPGECGSGAGSVRFRRPWPIPTSGPDDDRPTRQTAEWPCVPVMVDASEVWGWVKPLSRGGHWFGRSRPSNRQAARGCQRATARATWFRDGFVVVSVAGRRLRSRSGQPI